MTVYQVPAKFKPTRENLAKVKAAKWWGANWKLLNEMSVDEILQLDHFASV
jgi:hypothetical protein